MPLANKKLKAFTLGEMLVTLVVSTLVIGLAMLILSLINKQLNVIYENTNNATEIRLFEKALWNDFNTYNLFFDTKQQHLMGISEIDTVNYYFSKTYVIRNQDTLMIPAFKVLSYLDGNSVTNGDIDALELQLSEITTAQKIFVYKTKDVAFYMNTDGI